MSLCKRLVFTSHLVNQYGRDLPDLLNQSANRSASLGISSMLLAHHGKLIQMIEGDPNLVDRLWQGIHQDARYFNQCVVTEEMLDRQSFQGTHAGLGQYALVSSDKLHKEVQIFNLVLQEIEQRLPATTARDYMAQFLMECI